MILAKTASYNHTEIDSSDVAEGVSSGLMVSQIQLQYNDRCSFVINNKMVVKSIKFTDVVEEQVESMDIDNQEDLFDSQFALMTLEFRGLIADVQAAF